MISQTRNASLSLCALGASQPSIAPHRPWPTPHPPDLPCSTAASPRWTAQSTADAWRSRTALIRCAAPRRAAAGRQHTRVITCRARRAAGLITTTHIFAAGSIQHVSRWTRDEPADAIGMLRRRWRSRPRRSGARGGRLHRAPVRREAPSALSGLHAVAPDTRCSPAPVHRALPTRRTTRRGLHEGHARAPVARSCATALATDRLLLPKPNAAILSATLARGRSCRSTTAQFDAHFMRELTAWRDRRHHAGGATRLPRRHEVIRMLALRLQLTSRLA